MRGNIFQAECTHHRRVKWLQRTVNVVISLLPLQQLLVPKQRRSEGENWKEGERERERERERETNWLTVFHHFSCSKCAQTHTTITSKWNIRTHTDNKQINVLRLRQSGYWEKESIASTLSQTWSFFDRCESANCYRKTYWHAHTQRVTQTHSTDYHQ